MADDELMGDVVEPATVEHRQVAEVVLQPASLGL